MDIILWGEVLKRPLGKVDALRATRTTRLPVVLSRERGERNSVFLCVSSPIAKVSRFLEMISSTEKHCL